MGNSGLTTLGKKSRLTYGEVADKVGPMVPGFVSGPLRAALPAWMQSRQGGNRSSTSSSQERKYIKSAHM